MISRTAFCSAPSSYNAGGANRSNAINLAKAIGRCFDNVEHFFPKGVYEFLCVNRPHPSDHPRR